MTTDLFGNYLKGLNSKMKARNRHILLFMDNFSSHTGFEEKYNGVSSNVEIKILHVGQLQSSSPAIKR